MYLSWGYANFSQNAAHFLKDAINLTEYLSRHRQLAIVQLLQQSHKVVISSPRIDQAI